MRDRAERAAERRPQPERRSVARWGSAERVLALQRTAGNVATARTLARNVLPPPPGFDHTRIHGALAHLKALGLPTDALDGIVDQLRFVKGGAQPSFQPGLLNDDVELSERYLSGVEQTTLSGPPIVGANPGSLFHELTHAFMYFHRKDADLEAILAEARAAYTGSPMQDGSASEDPARVLQEAAAEYVGGRVATYFGAVQTLSSASAKGALTQAVVDRAAKDYDRGMAVRVYGYEERGGLFSFQTKEVHSAANIPERLRGYLDARILANRFAEHFADDPSLRSFTPGP